MAQSNLQEVVGQNHKELLTEWVRQQMEALGGRRDRLSEAQVRAVSEEFLNAFSSGLAAGGGPDIHSAVWQNTLSYLASFSQQRVAQGFSTTETAILVFSLKPTLFANLTRALGQDAAALATELTRATELLDKLGLYTVEVYQKSRESVIVRQQQELLELSTPVVELWNGILALPLIGTLDSARTQIVMQNLLEAIVGGKATIAIIDITGVPTVDTLVAQHLLKTVAAARLMGAECIISGIRPQIAQTIIHLGVDLSGVVTKATLAGALQVAMRKKNLTVVPVGK